jgi:hypothetical protein
MKNRWLLNVVLAAIVGALVFVVVYKPGSRQPAATPLAALAAADIGRLRLLRPKQPEVVLEKHDGAWHLTAPRRARANGFRVNDLAALAATPVKTRFAAAPEALTKYGLDRPVATVFLNDAEFRFGALHPLHNEVYVLHAGQVQLVPATALRAATVPVEDLLSPNLLEDGTKIVSLRLPGFSLKQNDQGAWVRTPELKDLSSDAVNRFVDEWRYARALSVAPARAGGARDQVSITVADGDKTRTLEFGIAARKPELVLVRADEKLEYHFPEDAIGRLLDLKPEKQETAPAAGGNPAN